MLMVLSPSKTLASPPYPPMPITARSMTQPRFLDDTQFLAMALRQYSPARLQKLMDISPKLAALNVQRYKDFSLPFTRVNAHPALFTFQGDVYDGLDAASFTAGNCRFAQKHLRILSGFYGLLRPLDLMQPYRLEMGIPLATKRGKDLYAFWGERITEVLNHDIEGHKSAILLNLASQEYFAAVHSHAFMGEVVTVDFKDSRNGKLQTIGLFAKKARGMMAAYIIKNRIDSLKAIRSFTGGGYTYSPQLSDKKHVVFIR